MSKKVSKRTSPKKEIKRRSIKKEVKRKPTKKGVKPKASIIKGIILNYRLGPFTQHNKEFLTKVLTIQNESEASKYIGRRVVWRSIGGKKIVGKVAGIHGKNGVMKVRFRTGLPGQAIGTNVDII
ncbi:50S ribosomal protein L35ae [[Eubacterium] cellulosolvens]